METSKSKKSLIGIILILVVGCIAMAITDGVISPPYMIKSLIKIFFFLVVPVSFLAITKSLPDIKSIIIPNKKGFLKSLLLGIAIFAVIIGGYFIARNFYDFNQITGLLTNNIGVTGNNFVYVAIYISFCNSLLEEFFFRGLAFLYLSRFIGIKWAYLLSSFLFAVYHIAMMTGWFNPVIFILVMLGLMVGGMIFNFLDKDNGNIYNSWMSHMFANFAINTIGFILFGII